MLLNCLILKQRINNWISVDILIQASRLRISARICSASSFALISAAWLCQNLCSLIWRSMPSVRCAGDQMGDASTTAYRGNRLWADGKELGCLVSSWSPDRRRFALQQSVGISKGRYWLSWPSQSGRNFSTETIAVADVGLAPSKSLVQQWRDSWFEGSFGTVQNASLRIHGVVVPDWCCCNGFLWQVRGRVLPAIFRPDRCKSGICLLQDALTRLCANG